MTEQIVTFETAKLAKEKGFDEECKFIIDDSFPHYHTNPVEVVYPHQNSELLDSFYTAPTQALLQKWLRDVHKIYISIEIEDEDEFLYSILDFYTKGSQYIPIEYIYSTYEDALEAALVHALILIK